MRTIMLCGALAAAVMFGGIGCEDRGGSSGSAASGLDVNGFWEGTTPNGSTCAATLVQDGANVTSGGDGGLAKINRMGRMSGTLSGYNFKFTMSWDDGSTEEGSGTFDKEGMQLDANLPSVGDFYFSWRGPSYAEHSKLSEPLAYSK
ncbi:MAG: hypothetical protein WCS01_01720 [bacterium]